MTYSLVDSEGGRANQHQLKAKPTFRIRLWILEAILSCLVVSLLVLIANPLSDGNRPLGLNQRYSVSQTTLQTTIQPLPFIGALKAEPAEDSKRLRAQWLNEHAGVVLILFAACGLITLNLGRNISRSSIKLPLIAAWWCVTANFINAFNARWSLSWLPDVPGKYISTTNSWFIFAGVFLLLALFNVIATSRSSQSPTNAFWKCTHSVASPWVYPGFVLFCGLGWIWLTDWAARGHLNKQFVGIYQIDSLWIAMFILTVIASQQGQLLAGVSRFSSWLDNLSVDRMTMPNCALMALLLLWIISVGAIGHLSVGNGIDLKMYQRHSALLAELMRVPIWLALGWILYRWMEKGQRSAQALVALGLLLFILVAGLRSDHDGGPILAQTVAVTWIFSGLVLAVLRRSHQVIGWFIALAVAIGGTTFAVWLGYISAPGTRIDAMALDFHGSLDFLSVMHWLQDAVPATGFGIGKTPWCGYAQVAGLSGQCLRAGVPDQIQSDYVSFALLAVWGWLATLVVLSALLLWLWELVRNVPAKHNEALNFSLLRQWIVMGFAVTSGVQIAISAAGTLGKMPLTGIAIPMLSLGGAGLISTAIFAGLSINAAHFTQVRMLKLVKKEDEGNRKTTHGNRTIGRPL